jgi:hypothetical protein
MLDTMSGSSKADLAAAATSTVLTADQLMRAIEASHEGKEEYASQHHSTPTTLTIFLYPATPRST